VGRRDQGVHPLGHSYNTLTFDSYQQELKLNKVELGKGINKAVEDKNMKLHQSKIAGIETRSNFINGICLDELML
jgi:hypothetical protein